MRTFRNLLVTLGILYLFIWLALFFAWPIIKLRNGIILDDGLFGSTAMGLMLSLHRVFAAIVAGILVVLMLRNDRPFRWAVLLALLTIPVGPINVHAFRPLSFWEKYSYVCELVFPAFACLAAAALATRSLKPQLRSETPSQPDPESA